MIGYRHVDFRYPFLWEDESQPPGRWHADGEGPVNYFADSPDGAWAEFLRHEEITEPEDLAGVQRSIWVVDLRDLLHRPDTQASRLDEALMTGGLDTYPACQAEARSLRAQGARAITAPAATLLPDEAAGFHTDHGLRRAQGWSGGAIATFGRRPDLEGWQACAAGRPNVRVLSSVRPF